MRLVTIDPLCVCVFALVRVVLNVAHMGTCGKGAFGRETVESEHLKAEDVCVCVFDTSTFIFSYRRDGWTCLSLVHMEDLDLVYTNTIF